MSFKPIVFSRTIPPTTPSQVDNITSSAISSTIATTTAVSTSGSSSNAANLSSQLSDLIDTAQYLQNVILSLNSGLGVPIDASTDPETSKALSQVYGGQIPPAISVAMYSYTLDAELGASQVNLAAGPNSSVQANPFQYQAVLTINKAVESSLASSNNTLAQSALLLRRLKADIVTNTNIQAGLATYPAATGTIASTTSNNVIPAASIDASTDVTSAVQSYIDQSGQNYSSVYQTLAQPDPIAADVGNVIKALVTVSVPNLMQINGLLQMTSTGTLTQSITGLSTGLSAFVYSQLLTQSSGMLFNLDQIAQMALSPVKNMTNQVGSILTALSGASKGIGQLVGVVRSMIQGAPNQNVGPLSGMPLNNYSQTGLANSTNTVPASITNLGLSSGLNELSSLLSFSINSSQTSSALHQDSFQRLSSRSTNDSGSLIKCLAVSSSITSLTSLVGSLISAQQKGSSISSQAPATQLSTLSQVLSNSSTGNGTSYTVQGGTVIITPPNIPAPTTGATKILAKSGIQTSLTGLSYLS